MSSGSPTTTSTAKFSDKIRILRKALAEAQAVVVGAGAGLSVSAGFSYSGERFERYFSDFERKYGFHDMYSGGFYPFAEAEEFWAYWSRYIYINRYMDAPKPVYNQLLALLRDKDYFVITTNVDHCFQKAGIDKERLFYTQGDYGLFQCSEPCSERTYDNEETVRKMLREQRNMRIPSELLPRCPRCGRLMSMNLRSDETFAEDSGWHEAKVRYERFLHRNAKRRVLFWELGVGLNTPAIIKYPFWQMTARNPAAVYACVNLGGADCPREIAPRAVLIDADIGAVLDALLAPPGAQT